ncbi:MAG: class I SAM-dependent methyltransferase family protein [Streptosporangiaceae bacterium]
MTTGPPTDNSKKRATRQRRSAAGMGQDGPMPDWAEWQARAYDDPSSALRERLRRVQGYLSQAIDRAPAGPVRLVSLCAGQGRDVLHVVPGHPRRDDVSAVLVELDARNAEAARRRAAEAGLGRVEVRQADASRVAAFADALPAGVLLLCGIFGNISDSDIERTVTAAPALCADGATVIWTRSRRPPDVTPRVRAWFADQGFDEIAFDTIEGETLISVGVNRLRSARPARPPEEPLFTFIS